MPQVLTAKEVYKNLCFVKLCCLTLTPLHVQGNLTRLELLLARLEFQPRSSSLKLRYLQRLLTRLERPLTRLELRLTRLEFQPSCPSLKAGLCCSCRTQCPLLVLVHEALSY
jgi:hypothetical protein